MKGVVALSKGASVAQAGLAGIAMIVSRPRLTV